MRSAVGAAATGRVIDAQELAAVILKAGGEKFGSAVRERAGQDDDRSLIQASSLVGDLRVRLRKCRRVGRTGFHRSLNRFDPGGQATRAQRSIALLQLAQCERERRVDEVEGLGLDWLLGANELQQLLGGRRAATAA